MLIAKDQKLHSDIPFDAWLRGVTLTLPANMALVGGVLEGLFNNVVSSCHTACTCAKLHSGATSSTKTLSYFAPTYTTVGHARTICVL